MSTLYLGEIIGDDIAKDWCSSYSEEKKKNITRRWGGRATNHPTWVFTQRTTTNNKLIFLSINNLNIIREKLTFERSIMKGSLLTGAYREIYQRREGGGNNHNTRNKGYQEPPYDHLEGGGDMSLALPTVHFCLLKKNSSNFVRERSCL